ncbi:helicase-related protein [Psychromonas sp. SP041]|uniref:DEAD/DEAH box helicase n=1 Tax=Psychromonas sp. SP041 TaxID=1365007 RepID=UPI0010C79153|nr:helicase-related protein [Psychromonas sp. SP041]
MELFSLNPFSEAMATQNTDVNKSVATVENDTTASLFNTFTFFNEEYIEPLSLAEKTSKTPRFYQANTVNSVADMLEQGFTRIGVKSPTGTGKTLITKLIALSTRVRNLLKIEPTKKIRVLYVSNKHRLNRQAEAEYRENSSVELILQSAMSSIPDEVMEKGWDITFLDESHHEAMHSIQKILTKMTSRPLIGFTADDQRGDGLLLKFERFHVAISEYDAARRGFTEKVGVNTVVDLGKNDKSELTIKLLEKYSTHMGNTIIFVRTEREARKIQRHLRYKMGLKAGILDSRHKEDDLDKALDKLSEGKIQFLVNCQKIGEGIDAENITDVVLARHFNSPAEKKQYIGRAIRPDSPCAVWEFTNPLVDSVVSRDVVGLTKYERLISIKNNQWDERLLSGEDKTWGQMSKLRVQPEITSENDLDAYDQEMESIMSSVDDSYFEEEHLYLMTA